MQNTAGAQTPSTSHDHGQGSTISNRSVWIWTGYAAAALGLVGVLTYHFATSFLR